MDRQLANVRKVMRGILDFYEDILHVPTSRLTVCWRTIRVASSAILFIILVFQVPQEKQLVEGDEGEMVKLLELLLGVAVQCPEKETHVQSLMSLDEQIKADLMPSIQTLLTITSSAHAQSASRNEQASPPFRLPF